MCVHIQRTMKGFQTYLNFTSSFFERVVIVLFALCLHLGVFSFSDQIFVVRRSMGQNRVRLVESPMQINALTQRQVQFWEDVDKGLNDIEDYYEKNGQDIRRIRLFVKSASEEIPPPTGSQAGHEPSNEHVYGLTANPFWDVYENADLFPWAKDIELNANIIQEEFEAKLLNSAKFASDSAFQSQVMGDGWSAIRLQRLGEWNTDNCKEFPKTYELLRSLNIPFAVRGVCFARQAPLSGVKPHSDGRNFILTSHLGLKVPEGCWIDVAGERREWQQGKLTTLDTSFVHSTENPSNSDRHVLILDYWHPELTESERAALDFIYSLRNKYDSGEVKDRKKKSFWSPFG